MLAVLVGNAQTRIPRLAQSLRLISLLRLRRNASPRQTASFSNERSLANEGRTFVPNSSMLLRTLSWDKEPTLTCSSNADPVIH